MRKVIPAFFTLVFLLCNTLPAADTAKKLSASRKKLIQYGWGMPTPDYLRKHIRTMEKRPFDGVVFKLNTGRNVLAPDLMKENDFAKDFSDCEAIEWENFSDNFIIMMTASDQDWFNDDHWQNIESNVRLFSRCARLARCAGVCLDAEPYGTNPWSYTTAKHKDSKSFAEYEKIVRKRGAQFIRAVESELPGAKILTFFQLSYFEAQTKIRKAKKRSESLSLHKYSFLPAFLNGMLDAATPEARIIDGNEKSYYYTNAEKFRHSRDLMKKKGLILIAPENRKTYRRQVQAGHALYLDYIFALRKRNDPTKFLSPREQAAWFEHNVYQALSSADEYVWCYSEHMNWFLNRNIPEGSVKAIESARQSVETGTPLSVDIKPVIEKAERLLNEDITARLKKRTASIPRLPETVSGPKIDARSGDKAWGYACELEPFVSLSSRPKKLTAQTRAKATYDDRAIYLMFTCEHKHPGDIPRVGKKRDDDIWHGEDIEILFTSSGDDGEKLIHFMLNPDNVVRDSILENGIDKTDYSPEWKHATGTGKKGWCGEVAIPWTALGLVAPGKGESLRVNLCRQYLLKGTPRELSTWSPSHKGFRESTLFGTWTF